MRAAGAVFGRAMRGLSMPRLEPHLASRARILDTQGNQMALLQQWQAQHPPKP